MHMAVGNRETQLLRVAADAAIDLDRALESWGDPPAQQAGLLWVFALLVAGSARGRAGAARVSASAGPAGGRLSTLLSEIDQACARVADVRAIVSELRCQVQAAQGVPQWQTGEASARVALLEQLWALADAGLRRRRGGYFTPQPIVRFIVRSVDGVLRRTLDVPGGLACAETPVRIIDPACGSGAFLLGVTQYVREQCRLAGLSRRWPRLAREVLSQRLVGIDLLPACCGAAEIVLQAELGTCWSAYCGNVLADVELTRTLLGDGLPVIIGNPPYANFGRANRGHWIRTQLEAYKAGLHEKKHNLGDDFIKFLRWGQYWIDQAGCGILAMITNNTYLGGLTHRQMRTSLMDTFDEIHVLDLHGNCKKRERTPAGDRDENVFGIQQGVAIGVFVKHRAATRRPGCQVRYAQLWGPRAAKLAALDAGEIGQPPGAVVSPRPPQHCFVPRGDASPCEAEYLQWPRLDQIFQQYVSGVQTKCDALFVGFTREEVAQRMRSFLAEASCGRFAAGLPAWLPRKTRGVVFDARQIRPYMVAPWDVRWVYYEPRLLGRARQRLLSDLDGGNLALVFMRQATDLDGYDHFLATRALVSDRVFYSAHGAPFVAPLFTRRAGAWTTNLSPRFLQELAARLGIGWSDQPNGLHASFASRDVFHWIYAQVHSPRYRQHFQAMLRIDFPRIPWPPDLDTFRALARAGRELVELHCGIGTGALPPAEPAQVEPAVWRFRIGGYPVLRRWLHQRRHRTLSAEDQQQRERIIHAIRGTLQLREGIDRVGPAFCD